jgi:hypothetical protein
LKVLSGSWSTFKESRSSKAIRFGSVNLLNAVGRIERLNMLGRQLLGARLGVIVESIFTASVESVEIDVLVQRTRATKSVVG